VTDDDTPGTGPEPDRRAVLEANDAFYAAFEAADIAAMERVWERSERAACTHPGWQRLTGWEEVGRSWAGILGGGASMQFILTDVRVDVLGDAATVLVDENIVGAQGGGGTVAAVNVFVRGHDGGWAMVGHHGSPVVRRVELDR
jgi:ketosteroid isomerase-like protein